MIVAVVGLRGLIVDNLEDYLPEDVTEIVSGGAKGVDSCARKYALAHNIKLTEFLPNYIRYGKSAPLRRNLQIIDYADVVYAFWDGESCSTRFVIAGYLKRNKKIKLFYTSEALETLEESLDK